MDVMNKLNLVLSIIKFFRDNEGLKRTDLGVLFIDNNNELVIQKYYEYDVTIFEYKNSIVIRKYQEYYADLSINTLESIYAQIEKYSKNLNTQKDLTEILA